MAKKKGKSPAFQLYASDFLVDTAEMTNEEVGWYIRLLCQQWVNGSIPSEPHRLPYAEPYNQDYGHPNRIEKAWPVVSDMFELGDDHRLRNPRLEKERKKKLEYIEKQTLLGKEGANKRWGSGTEPHTDENRVPHQNPNRENVALLSSTSILNTTLPDGHSRIDVDWRPSQQGLIKCKMAGLHDKLVERQIPVFASHHYAEQTAHDNWDGKFLSWCKRALASSWDSNDEKGKSHEKTGGDNRSRSQRMHDELDRIAQEDIELNGFTEKLG